MSRRARRPRTREEFAALASGRRPNDWTAAGVRRRCAFSAGVLLARGVDIATLDAWWPGGENNQQTRGIGPWVMCYAHYHYLARTTDAGGTDRDAELQQAIIGGVTGQPGYVQCTDGEVRAVYPKSMPVHFALSAIDAAISETAEPLARAQLIERWIWVITTPGSLAPFDIRTDLSTWPLPNDEWIAHLTPIDVLAFVQAFNSVDRHNIVVMCSAFPKLAGDPSRLSFAGFLGTLKSRGVDVDTESVTAMVAGAVSETITTDEARKRAELEASLRKPPNGRTR